MIVKRSKSQIVNLNIDHQFRFWGDDSIWDDNWDEDLESNKRRRFGTSGIGGNQHNLRTKAKLIEITGTDGYVYTVKKRIRYVTISFPGIIID
jgi:hypothetical protein